MNRAAQIINYRPDYFIVDIELDLSELLLHCTLKKVVESTLATIPNQCELSVFISTIEQATNQADPKAITFFKALDGQTTLVQRWLERVDYIPFVLTNSH